MKRSIKSRLLGFTLKLCYQFFKKGNIFYRSKLWKWLWEQEFRNSVRDYGGTVHFWDNGTWRP